MHDSQPLDYFAAVYRHRSFSAAANELGISQSSVTKRVRLLEEQLSLKLFNRTTRSVEPTDSARELIDHAENVQRAVRTFEQEARLLAGGAIGRIRVGAMALAAETLVIDALARLAETHRELEVDIIVGSPDIYRDLATGECDLAVGDEANFATSQHAGTLRTERIQHERLVYVHRRGHPGASTRELGILRDYPFAIPSRYWDENQLFEELHHRDRATPPRYRLNSLAACLSLASRSDVITLAPSSLIGANHPTLTVANVDPGIEFNLVLVTVARHTMTPAVRAFRAAMLSAL